MRAFSNTEGKSVFGIGMILKMIINSAQFTSKPIRLNNKKYYAIKNLMPFNV